MRIIFKPILTRTGAGDPWIQRFEHVNLHGTDLFRKICTMPKKKPISWPAAWELFGDIIQELFDRDIQAMIDLLNNVGSVTELVSREGYHIELTHQDFRVDRAG